MTRSESTFLAHGGAIGLEHRSLVAHSVPYFLHTCTNFGQWQAATRREIDRLINAASSHVDEAALAGATSKARSTGTTLVLEDAGEKLTARSSDPMAPGLGLHLRTGLICRALFYSHLYEGQQSDLRGVAVMGATFTDRNGAGRWSALHGACHEANLDLQILFDCYANAEQPVIQYSGEQRQTISSRLLLECYWALAEIVLLDGVDRPGTRSRLNLLSRHPSYAVIQFVLFGLKVLTNHYHALMLGADHPRHHRDGAGRAVARISRLLAAAASVGTP